MPVDVNELNKNALGGTEQMTARIARDVDPEVFKDIQLIPSRVRELDPTKIRVLYCQDLAEDPEAAKALQHGAWRNYHRIVFASNWQMQNFIRTYDIPWSKCLVIQNAIEPITPAKVDDGKIKLVYHSTPHRGLNILYPVVAELVKKYPNIHLDVFSSFKLYGWEERDAPFQALFDLIDANPNMTNHGTVSNQVVRDTLAKADIWAYPNTWVETSCISLIEAMSAGCVCIHPNLGALFETSGGWTSSYQFNENQEVHASWIYSIIDQTIQNLGADNMKAQVSNQKAFADVFHNWNNRKGQWEALFRSLKDEPRDMPKEMFSYNV